MSEQKKEKKDERIFIRVSESLKESIKVMSKGNMSKFIIDSIKNIRLYKENLIDLYEIMINYMKPIKKIPEEKLESIKMIEEILNV